MDPYDFFRRTSRVESNKLGIVVRAMLTLPNRVVSRTLHLGYLR